MNHFRRIPEDELPLVRDTASDELRPARSDRELANFGLVALGGDLYDCAHVDGTPEPDWGVKLVEGSIDQRFDTRLPPSVRHRVRRSLVLRAEGHSLAGAAVEDVERHRGRRRLSGRDSRIDRIRVHSGEVKPSDLVVDSDVPANRFKGER